MPYPEDVEELRGEVDVLVSCLEPAEAERFGLEREGGLCAAAGIEFVSFPIPDHTAPAELHAARELARGLAARVRQGRRVVTHCLAGIGRSPTIAAAALLELGLPLDDILRRMARARGYPVPEMPEQLAWLRRFVSPS